MKLGLNMYLRAIAQLFIRLWPAFMATAPAWVALTIVTGLAAYFIVGEAKPARGNGSNDVFQLPPFFWTYFLLSQTLSFATMAYIGPKFHRAMLPKRNVDGPLPCSEYLMGLMKLAFIGFVIMFCFSRLISVIAPTIPGPLGNLTLPLICMYFTLYIVLRLSFVLPATALARPRDMFSAWRATRPFALSAFVSLALLGITVLGLHSLALLWEGPDWGALVLGAIASWFALMIVLSYLSVLYRDARRIEHGMAEPT